MLVNAADTTNVVGDLLLLQAWSSAGRSAPTSMVLEERRLALNEDDRRALATYAGLEELHLDGNRVSCLPARYFSVVPQLRVLSLSRNRISR